MTVEAFAGLFAMAVSLAFILTVLPVLGLRAVRIAKRARRLGEHPVVLTLARFETTAGEMGEAASRLAKATHRFESIARSARRLHAAVGSLDLNLDRLAFATRLVLHMLDVRV